MIPSSAKPRASFLTRLINLFFKRKSSQVPPLPQVPPDNTVEPVRVVNSRVLLAVYDPVVDPQSGTKLSQFMHWRDVDSLVNGFIEDVLEVSAGKARFQVVQRMEFNEFPQKTDGFRYEPQAYLDVIRGLESPRQPETADYKAIMIQLNILPRIAMHEVDEIWLFGFPHAGFFESCMGGAGAFWCNSEPMTWTAGCPRRFVVMGFSFERGVGEMLESFGHRAESMLAKTFNCQDFIPWVYSRQPQPETTASGLNLFQQYLLYDLVASGRAGVGTIHHAPNSQRDYDWNNSASVLSSCHDWYNFPRFLDDRRLVSATEWGNGDIRLHHKWWFRHLPKVAGRTAGVANNWWQYVMDPNLVGL
jgi:hypothetical protein